jgi:hypothetical protein
MELHTPPGWLAEIRDYWARLTVQLADESGQPREGAGEEALPEGAQGATRARGNQRLDLPSLQALVEEAE